MSSIEAVSLKNQLLAKSIASELNVNLWVFKIGHFADGELRITPPSNLNLLPKKIILIHTFSFDVSINPQIFELLMFIGYLKQTYNTEIILVLPYLPYSRQDKNSLNPKKIGLIDILTSIITTAGVSKIITCDIHSVRSLEMLDTTIENISLAPLWSYTLPKKLTLNDNFILAAPDKGGINRVENISKILKLNYVFIEKQRIGVDKIKVLKLNGDVKGKNIILIDDIIDTGNTALKALNLLKKRGALKVIACFSHAVLASKAKEKLIKSRFEKIFITNSIQLKNLKSKSKIQLVNITHFLSQYLKRIL